MKKLISLLILTFSSCYVEPLTYYDEVPQYHDIKSFKKYIIKKGEHTSGTHIDLTNNDNIEAYIKLTESCNYILTNTEDQGDINKLIGLSDATFHQEASARIGWRSFDNNLEIYAYIRQNGKHEPYFLGIVNPNDVFYSSIEIFPNTYRITFDYKSTHKTILINRASKYSGVRYKLFPYFGGNQRSPQDITVFIKEI